MNQKPKPEAVTKSVESVDKSTYSLILGIRHIRTGQFSGLWELTELTGDVQVKRVITDANTRSILLNLAARAIGKAL